MVNRTRSCEYCGEQFTRQGTFVKVGRYCSKKCARDAWHAKNRAKENSRCKAWREANPETYKQCKRNWYANNKERSSRSSKNAQLKRDFGITIKQYEEMCEKQNNCCAICNKQVGKWKLRPDHCHINGCIRGLLCDKCNLGLGLFKDNPQTLMNAIVYLGKN